MPSQRSSSIDGRSREDIRFRSSSHRSRDKARVVVQPETHENPYSYDGRVPKAYVDPNLPPVKKSKMRREEHDDDVSGKISSSSTPKHRTALERARKRREARKLAEAKRATDPPQLATPRRRIQEIVVEEATDSDNSNKDTSELRVNKLKDEYAPDNRGRDITWHVDEDKGGLLTKLRRRSFGRSRSNKSLINDDEISEVSSNSAHSRGTLGRSLRRLTSFRGKKKIGDEASHKSSSSRRSWRRKKGMNDESVGGDESVRVRQTRSWFPFRWRKRATKDDDWTVDDSVPRSRKSRFRRKRRNRKMDEAYDDEEPLTFMEEVLDYIGDFSYFCRCLGDCAAEEGKKLAKQ